MPAIQLSDVIAVQALYKLSLNFIFFIQVGILIFNIF